MWFQLPSLVEDIANLKCLALSMMNLFLYVRIVFAYFKILVLFQLICKFAYMPSRINGSSSI